MQPNRVGRTVGVGTRLLARLVRSKAQQNAARRAAHVQKDSPVYKDRGRRLGQGSRRFGGAIFKPFAHASRILWLEITGIFFGVFTLFFGNNLWRLRADWAGGPSHRRFILYAVITVAFAYFTVTSFIRAARHNRAHRKNK